MTELLYVFGPFSFDIRQMLLLRDGAPMPIGRRGAVILSTLLSAKGQTVSKDDLMEAAWPGSAIEESNLSVQVSKIRRLIGETRIRTVERVGYQFVVEPIVAPVYGLPPKVCFPSIEITTTEPELMTAALAVVCAALSRFKSVRVIMDPSRLETDYRAVISPAPGKNSVNLAVVLVDCKTRRVLWGDRFAISDGVAVEDRIAAAVESAVQASEMVRGPRGSSTRAEAYWFYQRGRRSLNSSRAVDNEEAFRLFMDAINLEPENGAYLAAAAEAIHHRLSVGWQPLGADDKQICRELAFRTLALADGDAVSIALAGNALFTADEEDMGLALCRRALGMNATSHLVLACAFHAEGWGGSMEKMERLANLARGLAPNDPGQRFAFGSMATAAAWQGDHAAALDWGRRSLAVGAGFVGGHHGIIEALVQLGRQEEAERQVARYLAVSPGVTLLSFERGQHFADRGRLALRLNTLRRAGVPA